MPHYQDSYPQLDWHALSSLLQSTWQLSSLDKINITPLEGGHSRDSLFTLSFEENDYVLRMTPKHREGGEIVATLSELAGRANIGPNIIAHSPDSRVVLMEKLPGSTVKLRELQIDEGIASLAKGLNAIHQLTPPAEIKPERLFANIYQWQATQKKCPFLSHGIFKKTKDKYDLLLNTYESDALSQALLHGDINPSNIFLIEEQCYFIDWEFSGLGNPLLELARTCEWFAYDEKQNTLFLKSYFGDTFKTYQASIRAKRIMTYLEMFWLCLSFLPDSILNEEKILQLIDQTAPLTLNTMASQIEHNIPRQTHDEDLLKEAVGFFNQFLANT